MNDLVQLLIYFVGLFLMALATSYVLTRALALRNRRLTLQPGTILRLRCLSGMYRSTYLEDSKQGWVISAPLQRDSYVPLSVGDTMVVEAAGMTGALVFRSEIVARDPETHSFTLRRPSEVRRIERRGHKRVTKVCGALTLLEGEDAQLVDLSEVGARVATRKRLAQGERVRLDMDGREPVFGWVLEILPGSRYGYDSCEARLRFEQALSYVPG
jgi:hypothetical protein